jgi:hypothetical protein
MAWASGVLIWTIVPLAGRTAARSSPVTGAVTRAAASSAVNRSSSVRVAKPAVEAAPSTPYVARIAAAKFGLLDRAMTTPMAR